MGTMDDDLFHAIVDQLAGRHVLLLQPFLMNEPLMDKQIVPRLAYMKAKVPGARINITTNGVLLRPALVAELARLDLDSIHVSSNGLASDTYRATMGIDGAEVLANVNHLADALRAAGARTRLIVTALLLKRNREEVFRARDYWRSRGIEFFLNPLNDRAGNIARDRFEHMLPFDEDVNRAQLLRYDMSGCPALYCVPRHPVQRGSRHVLHGLAAVARARQRAREEPPELWHAGRTAPSGRSSDTGRLAERELCRKCGREPLQHRSGEPRRPPGARGRGGQRRAPEAPRRSSKLPVTCGRLAPTSRTT